MCRDLFHLIVTAFRGGPGRDKFLIQLASGPFRGVLIGVVEVRRRIKMLFYGVTKALSLILHLATTQHDSYIG